MPSENEEIIKINQLESRPPSATVLTKDIEKGSPVSYKPRLNINKGTTVALYI